jgi:sugar/nucleoside kinase (ribokinase family)
MTDSITAPRLVGIGAVFIDDIVLPTGQTYMAQLGGGVVHALMGAAIWGERPGIAAVIGRDLPDTAREQLTRYLDTAGLYELDTPQMRAWQIFETDGTRRELYRVTHIAPFIAGAQPERLPPHYRHSQGCYLLQSFEGIRAWRRALNGFVLWEPLQQIMVAGCRAQLRAVLSECAIDVVSPNLVEAQAVYGERPPGELVQALFEDGACIVALRMGAEGSLVADKLTGACYQIPAAPVRQLVDQTGAGNTYCGALLWGLACGQDLRAAAAAAAVSASFCLEQIGVVNPGIVDVQERNRRYQQVYAGK